MVNTLKYKAHAAYARQIARPEAKAWVQRDYLNAFPNKDKSPSWLYLSLPFSGLRKDIWEINKFYTQAWASEDTKMGYDLIQQGFKVKYLKDVTVMHSHNYTFRQIYNRKFVEGEADYFIFNKSYTCFNAITSFISCILKDTIFHIKVKAINELFITYIRRAIYFYAYYKGYKNARMRAKNKASETYGDYQ